MAWTDIVTALIAVGAFVMSGISLYFSCRKDSFDREVVTAEQVAALLTKIGELQVKIFKYKKRLATLRARYKQNGDPRLESIEIYQKAMDLVERFNEQKFTNISTHNRLTYHEIKVHQSIYDTVSIVLDFAANGTDELIRAENEKIPSEQPLSPP